MAIPPTGFGSWSVIPVVWPLVPAPLLIKEVSANVPGVFRWIVPSKGWLGVRTGALFGRTVMVNS